MSLITRKLILTGARAGTHCILRGLTFTNGEHTLSLPENEIDSLCKYMARVYKAFPEGHPQLKFFQDQDRQREAVANGAGETDAQRQGRVQGNLQPDGTGPATGAVDNGSGAAAPAPGAGQPGAGNGEHGSGTTESTDEGNALQQVIKGLDPKDDELWTVQGYPRCDAVAKASGREDITRKEVETAAPGFVRPAQ